MVSATPGGQLGVGELPAAAGIYAVQREGNLRTDVGDCLLRPVAGIIQKWAFLRPASSGPSVADGPIVIWAGFLVARHYGPLEHASNSNHGLEAGRRGLTRERSGGTVARFQRGAFLAAAPWRGVRSNALNVSGAALGGRVARFALGAFFPPPRSQRGFQAATAAKKSR
jgi:hypothetical protein